ncbi:hypothetical protein [Paucibacter sp. XJ19-41]|uniref:hypothetical protein n=1 Tax=Paucibacter sp. XJ19-41 TaxID=2927824 RepID=UPI00234932BF|nr:hypothetical protein [Paucibacter sp. XJ19-41]MDC6169706.1 hypothetical protein [Paucibacter sp. XJ19-41]
MPPLVFTIAGPGTEYGIDPVSLRAVALDPTTMRVIAMDLARCGEEGEDAGDAASKKSMAAFMLATAGAAASAECLLRDALRTQANGPARPLVVSRLRLVQVLQELDRPAEAVSEATAALAAVRSTPALADLEDFALHHTGKALLQAGDKAHALQVLGEALRLRQHKGDELLIRSSEMAISAAMQGRQVDP